MANNDFSTALEEATYLEPEIDAYISFLNSSNSAQVKILRKERVKNNLELYTNALNTFLVYPDILADIMTPKRSKFSMFFAQRIVLRSMARHRQTFATYTRAFSKSFLAFYQQYVSSMIVPRCNGFVTAGTKSQAAQIAKEKVIQDLWVKFPLLKNEMQKRGIKAAYTEGTDYAEFRFTSGSVFDVVGGHPRGMRRHKGVFEEVIEQDPVVVNEEIIPLMNAQRTNCRGEVNPYEPHGQKLYITTAGYQNTFAYDKNIETLCYCTLDPDHYMVLGGSYIVPLMHGRLEAQTMREIISSPSFDRGSLDREYKSRWSGAQSGAAFGPSVIAALRQIRRAEMHAMELDKEEFYIVTADMAKDGSADTAVIIFRVTPGPHMFNYKMVNLFTINSTDYEIVANELKKTIAAYQARMFIYDANGIGAALRDWINKPTIDRDTGLELPGYGIINPPKSAEKDIIKYPKYRTLCFEIKSGGKEGEHIHRIFFSRVSNGSVRGLIKMHEALNRFSENKNFLRASEATKRAKLQPYKYMDLMEEELKNLIIIDTSDNISNTLRIDRRNKKIQKDFFSAAEYGIYAVSTQIEQEYYKKRQKREYSWADAVLIN